MKMSGDWERSNSKAGGLQDAVLQREGLEGRGVGGRRQNKIKYRRGRNIRENRRAGKTKTQELILRPKKAEETIP